MSRLRTLFTMAVIFLMVVVGLYFSLERPASAQSNVQLTDVRLTHYLLPTGVWHPMPSPSPIPATALRLRFQATVVNANPRDKIRLKLNLHEICFLTSTKKFNGRFEWIGSNEPAAAMVVPDNRVVTIETDTHCRRCRATCGKGCPDRDHLGEGPHMASLTVAGDQQFMNEPEPPNGLRSFTAFVNFETFCPPETLRKSKPRTTKTGRKRA